MVSKYYEYQFSGIYSIRNTINNKVYIGSSKNIHLRMLHHRYELESNCHHCDYFQKSFNKYGINNFKIEILEKIDLNIFNEDYLYEREKYYINLYNSADSRFGYNMTTGGKGRAGIPMSKKIKKALKEGKKPVSEITRKRISDAGKGRKHTAETKEKMSKSRKGVFQWWNMKGQKKNLSEEERKKIGDRTRGIPRTMEQKLKSSKSSRGIKKYPNGTKTSSEYTGVSKMKNRKKWNAYIQINFKRVHLGYFENEIDGALAYNRKALEIYGKDAKINNIKKEINI
jgi:group I intron endonuclease